MKKNRWLKVLLRAGLLVLVSAGAVAAAPETSRMGEMQAPAVSKGEIAISGYWARQSFGRAVNSAAFMTIDNASGQEDTLVAGSSPICKRVELHTHINDGGVMRMREVEGGIKVPARSAAHLKGGGLHVMLIGLHKPLKPGETFPLTLTFARAGKVELQLTARKSAPKGMKHMDDKMMKH